LYPPITIILASLVTLAKHAAPHCNTMHHSEPHMSPTLLYTRTTGVGEYADGTTDSDCRTDEEEPKPGCTQVPDYWFTLPGLRLDHAHLSE